MGSPPPTRETGEWHFLLSAPDGAPNAGDQIGPVAWANLVSEYGGGNLIKGIDEAIQNMHYGETWKVLIPPELAFGEKGRSPSAGKPRIPGSTSLYYEISFVGFPGFEGDLFLQQNQ